MICPYSLRSWLKNPPARAFKKVLTEFCALHIGIINKIRAYALQDAGADTIEANVYLGLAVDLRRYEQCAEILPDLGLSCIRLMSNNPEKIRALKDCGLEVIERVPLRIKFHRDLTRYLRTKREQMGHLINIPDEFYDRDVKCSNRAV